MRPFPYDTPAPVISGENPMEMDGIEFVEFCHPSSDELDRLVKQIGYSAVVKHRSKDVTLYRKGDVTLVLNAGPGSFAVRIAEEHGPSAPAMAFLVVNA